MNATNQLPRTVLAALAVLALAVPALHAAPDAATSQAALDRLKALEGSWQETEPGAEGARESVRYDVTAAGHVVTETMFPGTDHEMVSVYYLDGDDLVMTHYCASGNHPRLVLDREASTGDTLVFGFDSPVNFEPASADYVHSGKLRVGTDGSLVESWAFHHGDQEAGEISMTLERTE